MAGIPASGGHHVMAAVNGLTFVQSTALTCCGMRVVDANSSKDPLLTPTGAALEELLAGEGGMARGERIWAAATASHGAEGHLYFAARCALVDSQVLASLQDLSRSAPGAAGLNVVNVGCGMDTRPWRLDLPPNVVWVDIDEPELLDMKRTQLQAAGAATGQQQQQAECAPPRFPLRAAAYHMLDCKVTEEDGELKAALAGLHGFDATWPTLWVAEGLLYYLHVPAVASLLRDAAATTTTTGKLITTVVSRECMLALQRAAREGGCNPAFCFYSCHEDVITGNGLRPGSAVPLAEEMGWKLDGTLGPDIAAHLAEAQPNAAPCYSAYTPGILPDYVTALRDVEHIAVLSRAPAS